MTITRPDRWARVRGTVGDTLVAELDGIGNVADITSIVAKVWLPRVAPAQVTLTAAVTNVALRHVTVQLGGAGGWLPTAQRGQWLMRLYPTFPGGAGPPIPEGTPSTIDVSDP